MPRRWPVLLVAVLLVAGRAPAQDTHYWNKQYGNRAYLLGAAVVGSSNDVSAVYYNPALLAGGDSRSLTVSGNAFYATSITLRNAIGDEYDLTSSSVGTVPSIVAGAIALGRDGKRRLAYSLLFRQDFDFAFEQRGAVPLPGLPGLPDVRLGLEENGREVWTGLSFAERRSDALCVGVSVFAAYRTHRSRRSALVYTETLDAFAAVLERDDFEYTHVGLLAKLGVGGRAGPWSWGFTFTTPKLRVAGTGARSFDLLSAAGELSGAGLETRAVTEYRGELSSSHHAPAAVAAGLSWRRARTTLHLSAEWFAAVSRYEMLDGISARDPATGEPFGRELASASRAVVNVGAGLEHEFGDRVHGYVGYHTDRSAAASAAFGEQVATWNIHHASGGVSLNFGDKRVALGAVYAFADQVLPGTVDLVAGGDAQLPQELEARYRSFLLLLGFDVNY